MILKQGIFFSVEKYTCRIFSTRAKFLIQITIVITVYKSENEAVLKKQNLIQNGEKKNLIDRMFEEEWRTHWWIAFCAW